MVSVTTHHSGKRCNYNGNRYVFHDTLPDVSISPIYELGGTKMNVGESVIARAMRELGRIRLALQSFFVPSRRCVVDRLVAEVQIL